MHIKLIVIKGPHQGQEFVFRAHDNFLVGRGSQAHFRLPTLDKCFSRLHFLVEVNPPYCRLLDLNSRNGTRVNRNKVLCAELQDGDVIWAGKTLIRISIQHESESVRRSTADEMPVVEEPDLNATIVPEPVDLPPEDSVADGNKNDDLIGGLPTNYHELIAEQDQPIRGYELIREVGRGSMGTVYLALRKRDQAVLAVKTLRPAVAPGSRETQRFLREASVLERLRHKNIVSFREMGVSGGMLFFAMDYVPTENAHEIVRRSTAPFPIDRAVRIACQVLKALEFAHAMGFVHRDVKPSNLLIVQQENCDLVKLADFGLARVYQESRLSGLTMTGEVGGTVPFMPPEQITDFRHAKPTADQYSVAATLYFLLSGKPVYDFPQSASGQLMLILQESPVPIQQRSVDIPDQLAVIIHRALARDPADRFKDVSEFYAALRRFK